MAWHLTDDIDEFLTAAGDFLRAQPVQNTVLLTVSGTLRERGPAAYGAEPPVFGWCDDGAFLRTPPRGALLSAMSPATATDLATLLADQPLPSVVAPAAVADVFAARWHRLTGATAHVVARQRLFRLEALAPPTPPPAGRARVAEARDRDLLIDWMKTFQHELGEEAQQTEEFVDDKLSYGGMRLWESDGEPVSMAGISRREAGMARVMAVYTPREHRAKGYAGAITVAVSRAALDAGATDVVLFTDVTNPTSNALYQRIGYTPIEDRSLVLLRRFATSCGSGSFVGCGDG